MNLLEELSKGKKMERVFKAPEKVTKSAGYKTLFLAGSIEMGKAKDWQTELTDKILKNDKLNKVIIVNPRRDDWDSTWEQVKTNKNFFEQVSWELENIEKSDFMVIHFNEKTQSPITLLELGLASQLDSDKCIVFCEDKFFRKGNVDIVCDRYGIETTDSFDGVIKFLENKLG